MKTTMQILRDLAPLNRAVCSRGYDQAVDYLCEVLPFRVISGAKLPPAQRVGDSSFLGCGRGQDQQRRPHGL